MSRAILFDAAGRKVMDLVPGPNDVSRLAPGVYFVLFPHLTPLPGGERKEERGGPSAVSREPSAVHKVIVAR